jgi:hypothetical protein
MSGDHRVGLRPFHGDADMRHLGAARDLLRHPARQRADDYREQRAKQEEQEGAAQQHG